MTKTQTKVMDISFISLFWQILDKRLETIASNSSVHGWNWYLKASKVWKKVLVIVPLNILFAYVCYACSVRIYDLYDSLDNVSASQKEKFFEHHTYPKLTLCHPSFFNKNLLQGIILLSNDNVALRLIVKYLLQRKILPLKWLHICLQCLIPAWLTS